MPDRFLHRLRRDPAPGFARDLRERLRATERVHAARPRRLMPAFAAAAGVAVVASLFLFPAVRVSAQAVLDLFRVRHFVAVRYDATRMERLHALDGAGDASTLVFGHQETVRDPGPPRAFADAAAAEAATGIKLPRASVLPRGLAPDSVIVQGAGELRLMLSEQKLRGLLDRLDLRDVEVPAGIDGKVVEVRKPPVVVQTFRSPRAKAALLQCVGPELGVPAGLEVERLAEIGLRVIGLDAAEARRVARDTDWRTTLVVPVPLDASSFRHVTVNGQRGLLITTAGKPDAEGRRRGGGTLVMWTEGERVLAVVSELGTTDAMELAESVR